MDLAISRLWRRGRDNELDDGYTPNYKSQNQNFSRNSQGKRNSKGRFDRINSMDDGVLGRNVEEESTFGTNKSRSKRDIRDEDVSEDRDYQKKSTKQSSKRSSAQHNVSAGYEDEMNSLRNRRKYKSVEQLKSSSSDDDKSTMTESAGSMKVIEVEKKVKQKQLYHELRRKQENARKSGRNQEISQAIRSSVENLDAIDDPSLHQGPPPPPKPKKYQSKPLPNNHSLPRSHNRGRHEPSESEQGSVDNLDHEEPPPITRKKINKHNEVLNEYLEQNPVAAHIRTGLTDDELDEDQQESYRVTQTRSHDRRKTKDRRNKDQYRSYR